MKLSDWALVVLKNFATINQSVNIPKGNTIKTINIQKTVVAIATVEDDFPSSACIYDLSRFLSTYGLYSQPDLSFKQKNFVISEGNRKTTYMFADPAMIIAPDPSKTFVIPSIDVEVNVPWSDLQSVIKAAGVLQLPEIAFVGEGGRCYLRAINEEDPSADSFGIELCETNDTFQLIIKTENLKLLPQDYMVSLSARGVSNFKGKNIEYFVAVEHTSKYKKGD